MRKAIGSIAAALSATGAFFVLAASAPAAHAASAPAPCGVTPNDVAQIAAVQNDPTLDYSAEIKKELAVRKQLVGQTIACAVQEAQALKAALASSSMPNDSAVRQLQSQLIGDIGQSIGYYNSESSKLNVVGIAGTQQIAQEMLAWRASSFVPLAENVNNLILWAKNQALFTTAQTRMAQTDRAVSFIESATPNTDLQDAFTSAQADLANAQTENASARTALVQGLSPDQTLGIIKHSLDSLSATYQDFFNVSTIISGILPQ